MISSLASSSSKTILNAMDAKPRHSNTSPIEDRIDIKLPSKMKFTPITAVVINPRTECIKKEYFNINGKFEDAVVYIKMNPNRKN